MKCKHCQSIEVVRFGIRNNIQRYRCKSCKKLFLESYKYVGSKPSTNDKVKRLTKEGLGIRNISRFLEISTTTVHIALANVWSGAWLSREPNLFFSTFSAVQTYKFIKWYILAKCQKNIKSSIVKCNIFYE